MKAGPGYEQPASSVTEASGDGKTFSLTNQAFITGYSGYGHLKDAGYLHAEIRQRI